MKGNRRRFAGLFFAAFATMLLATFFASPALADSGPSGPASPMGSGAVHKTGQAKISDKYLQGLKQLKFKKDGDPSGKTFAVAADPDCAGQWEDLDLTVEWYYPDDTGITDASDAYWTGYVNCTGMAYTAASTDLVFRSAQVARGTEGFCGTYEGDGVDCGYSSSFGDYPCAGIGNCGGYYSADLGITVSLPRGYSWTTVPDFCSTLYVRDMFCAVSTTPIWVPVLN